MLDNIKTLLNRSKETPHIRIAYTVMIASILLVASLAAMNPLNAAGDDGKKIRATGTYVGRFVTPNIYGPATVSGLTGVVDRVGVNNFTGDLSGQALQHQTLGVNDTAKRSFGTGYGTFYGTLAGSEPGAFSFILRVVGNRAVTPITFESEWVVIEGTGSGGLAGICGGGTALGTTPAPGAPFITTYDFTFRFGKDCKAND